MSINTIFLDEKEMWSLTRLVEKSQDEVLALYDQWKNKKQGNQVFIDQDFIASLLGVSKTTVSNYINNKLVHISLEKQKKLKQVIDLLEYVPSQAARMAKITVKKSFGVIINISSTPSLEYTNTLLASLKHTCNEIGYSLQIFDVLQEEQQAFITYMPFLGTIDGLFIVGAYLHTKSYKLLERYNIPVVLINPWIHVKHNNVLAIVHVALDGLEELIKFYYTNVSTSACLLSIHPNEFKERQKKIALFEKYYQHLHVVYIKDYSPQSLVDVFDELQKIKTNLFFCLSDITAISVKGMFNKIGRDVWVTGYDNIALSSIFNICTVDHNLYEQGTCGVRLMLDGLHAYRASGKWPAHKDILLESKFINKNHKEEL